MGLVAPPPGSHPGHPPPASAPAPAPVPAPPGGSMGAHSGRSATEPGYVTPPSGRGGFGEHDGGSCPSVEAAGKPTMQP